MQYIYNIGVFAISVFIWSMIWTNLLLPWIYSVPKFYWCRKEGLLKKPIPFARIIFGTILWLGITFLTLYLSLNYFSEYLLVMNIAAILTFIVSMIKYFKNDPELFQDFLRANKERLG
jgi:hypothetical protein